MEKETKHTPEEEQPLKDFCNHLESMHRESSAKVIHLQTELSEMKENYEGMVSHCKYLTEINVFNMCFDKADEHWRKSHKVEEGDNFIDWYMRHHAAEREADRKQLSEMKKEREELVKENESLSRSLECMIKVSKQPTLTSTAINQIEMAQYILDNRIKK